MDIRKHIIILCLLCCHTLGVMADGQIVHNYESIRTDLAKKYFDFRDSRITVTGVSRGDYKTVGYNARIWIANPTESKKLSFALKVKCNDSFNFTFDILEHNISQATSDEPTYEHTLIVDGQAKVKTKLKDKTLSEKISFELSAGDHEIVIMSSSIDGVEHPHTVTIRNMCLHAHSMGKEYRRAAYCGQDGYIKRYCLSCDYIHVDMIPMPAPAHTLVTKIELQGSCRNPCFVYDECGNCHTRICMAKKRKVWAHNFQNGRCINEGCGIKLPVQNAAGVYQVGDAYELRGLAEQIQAENISRACNIDLTADIVYPADLEHIPIGSKDFPFAGTFDGHGHHIGNIQTPSAKDMTGLFGYVKGTPRRPAVIANVIIDSNSKLKGHNMTGAVAGRADYCDIMRCVSLASVRGDIYVGGIVGYSGHECHVIDCAGLGNIETFGRDGGLLFGILRQGYIMDSYSSGSPVRETSSALVPAADSPLRHCFQLDAKVPMTGVTAFSSAQLSDGKLARMLCEKNGKDMPAHWQQGTTDGYPMPVFVALTDRPASAIQPQTTRAVMPASSVNTYSEVDEYDEGYDEEDEEWYSFSPESDLTEELPHEDFVFYDEADSTLKDFTCYVTTTFHNMPAMPMFEAMHGGDATECNVIYAKKDCTVIMEYNYTMDGRRHILTDATKQYTTPDSVVHVEHYDVEVNEEYDEFLMTSNMVFRPDHSGYEEKVSHGVATRVEDWEVTQTEGTEPSLNYYIYDEDGQERVDVYSISLSDKAGEGDDLQLPVEMEYTLDEYDRPMDLHFVLTDSLTGEKYIIGGEYYIYDEQGEQVQVVSYEPVEPHSHEMRQTEYCTIHIYKADDTPTNIIPIEHLQPGTLHGSSARTSGHVYDLRGNLVRLNNDATTLKSLPKGIYITRGKKILVH